MVDSNEIILYRKKTRALIVRLRHAIYASNGRTEFPTDKSIAGLVGVTPTAFSSVSRCCASASGIFLYTVLRLLSTYLSKEDFVSLMAEFLDDSDYDKRDR